MTDEDPVEIGMRLLRGNPYGFLGTVSGTVPRARLVQHLAVDDDGTVWIGTSPRSRKAAEVAANPRVTYAVEDRADFAYLTVLATAALVDDETERTAKWQDGLAAFFPDGPLGDDFVLIRLRPERWELMDFAHQIHPDPYGLAPLIIDRTPTGWTVLSG